MSTARHASTTDPDSRRYRKSAGKESKPCYMGHATMENRNGRAVAELVTQASGTAERAASEKMLAKKASPHARITVGADKAYDVAAPVERLRARNSTPHIAVNAYVTKTGAARKTKYREVAAVAADFLLNLIGYNLHPHPETAGAEGIYASENTNTP